METQDNSNTNTGRVILTFLAGFIFVAISAWVFSIVTSAVNPSSQNTPPTRPVVSCPADYQSYTSLINGEGSIVDLVKEKTSMYASGGKFINSKIVVTKNETETSKVACGYLYVRAGTDKGPLKEWEHVYINPNEFGGHIDSSTQIGPGDGNKFSEYVFPLDKVRYWADLAAYAQQDISTADWAALLNVSPKVEFWIGFSTTDASGFVEGLSIAYKCWNPITGEENKGCKLTATQLQ